MTRWWPPYTLGLLALVLSSISLWRSYRVTAIPPAPHRLAAAEPASPSYYANERGINRYHVADPICAGGAVGDDAHDDTAAISSCNTQAQAANSVVVFDPPSVAYKTTSELSMQWPGRWKGECASLQACIIRAHSPMRSVLEMRALTVAIGATDNGPNVAIVEGLTFDANHLANSGILLNGAENARVQDTRVINANGACLRNTRMFFAMALSGITATVPGGSPSTGMTVTQPDPNYYFLGNSTLTSSPDTVTLKIVGAGALGTATYALSVNAGAYSPTPLPLASQFSLVTEDGGGFVQKSSGLRMAFPAGTYHTNDTYSFTATATVGDIYGDVTAENDFMVIDKPQLGTCGSIYSTSALSSHYNNYNHTSLTGTASVTAGNQMVLGSATNWMSAAGAEGARGVIQIGSSGLEYTYAAIVDDTHIALVPGWVPPANLSGQDYAFSTYGAYYEDGGGQGSDNRILSPIVGFSSTAFNIGSGNGAMIEHGVINEVGLSAIVDGASVFDTAVASLFLSVGMGGGTTDVGKMQYMLSPNSSGTIIESFGTPPLIGGNPGSWILSFRGQTTPLTFGQSGSWVPNSLLALNASTQNITSATQQIVLPDLTRIAHNNGTLSGITSYIRLTSNADYTLTAFPLIPTVTLPGVILVLQNMGGHVLTFEDDAYSASGLQLQATHEALQPGDMLTLVSNGAPGTRKYWIEQSRSAIYAAAALGRAVGNTGTGRNSVQTTASTVPVKLYCVQLTTSNISPGTVLKFDVFAQSQSGANVGAWMNNVIAWDGAGNFIGFTTGTQFGTGSGSSVPLGWALSYDTSGAVRCINFAGDNSANTVTASIVADHRDPGQ